MSDVSAMVPIVAAMSRMNRIGCFFECRVMQFSSRKVDTIYLAPGGQIFRLRLEDGRVFEDARTFDPNGRLLRLSYPNGISVLFDYDSTSTLVQLRNGSRRAGMISPASRARARPNPAGFRECAPHVGPWPGARLRGRRPIWLLHR